jgi:hypothetical protein
MSTLAPVPVSRTAINSSISKQVATHILGLYTQPHGCTALSTREILKHISVVRHYTYMMQHATAQSMNSSVKTMNSCLYVLANHKPLHNSNSLYDSLKRLCYHY